MLYCNLHKQSEQKNEGYEAMPGHLAATRLYKTSSQPEPYCRRSHLHHPLGYSADSIHHLLRWAAKNAITTSIDLRNASPVHQSCAASQCPP